MAREDVNIKVSANVAEAIRMWKAMEEGPEGMARQLGALGAKGKKASVDMGAGLDNVVGKWASVATGIGLAKAALDAYMKSQQEALDITADATRTADKMSRELYQLTNGKTSLRTISDDLFRLAEDRGAQPSQAKEALAAVLGAGYSYGDATRRGGAADVVLQTLAATNATGDSVDTKGLVDALTGHLEATGQAKTPANLLAAGQAIQGLFAGTKLEMIDLQQLAPRAKNIYDATKLGNEQIAIMSQFKDVSSAEKGATAFQTSVMRLQGAGNIPQRARALGEMGLKPEDVDFAGEDFFEVQRRMAAGFERAGARAPQLKQTIFGNEGILGANVLFSREGAAQTQERLRLSRDSSGFNRAVSVMEGGLEGKANSAEARSMSSHSTLGFTDPETARKEMMSRMKDAEVGPVRRIGAETMFDYTLWATQNPDVATGAGVRFAGGSRELSQDIIEKSRANSIESPAESPHALSRNQINQAITITLQDQNGVSIPHKSEVHKVGTNKPSRK